MNRVPGYEKEMQNIYFCVSTLVLLKISPIAIYQQSSKIVNAFIVVDGAMGNNCILSGNVEQGFVISKEANSPVC